MKISTRFCAVLAVWSIVTPCMCGWDHFGHMAVAFVAYKNLDDKTRLRVDELLKKNPFFTDRWPAQIPAGTPDSDRGAFLFALAATWPDDIKGDADYHNDPITGSEVKRNTGYDDKNQHRYWHFADTPFSQDGTALPAVPTPNAQTQIAAFREVLASTSSDDLKSYDLVWLAHLIGDIHQPLHCSTRVSPGHPKGDRGGNDVGFCSATAKKCSGELHAFWDNILGTSKKPKGAKTLADGLTVPTATAGDAANWIDHSFKLAKQKVYVDPVGAGDGPFQSTPKYTTAAKRLARQEVALAGARLAAVLNAELQ